MAISVKKNIVYSFAYQALAFVIPLVTSPYIARVLGSEKIGIYSYTYSVAYYFMMAVMLGIINYGTRTIAKSRDNTAEMTTNLWSIYLVQCVMLVLSLSTYFVYCFVRQSEFLRVELCQSLFILSYGLDITWYFNGKEAFKLIAIRNGLVKILSAALIFTLVKSPDDVWIYTLIMSGSALLGQLIQWPYMLKEVRFKWVKLQDSKKHIRGILVLFIPVLAISIFVYMDKIMIGVLSNMSEAGFYENSDKLLSMPKSLIQAVGSVMLPHTANMLINGSMDRIKQSIRTTMFAMIWIACAGSFGLAGIAPMFSVVFWGADFARCSDVITVISISLLFSCFGNVIRTQYLIPKERDKEYTISLIAGAVVNLVVNYLLIGRLGAVGAAIGTIAAEIALCAYQVWCVRKELEIGLYILRGVPFVVIGVVMTLVLRLIQRVIPYGVLNLLLLIAIGGAFYISFSFLYLLLTKDKFSHGILDQAKNRTINRLHFQRRGQQK